MPPKKLILAIFCVAALAVSGPVSAQDESWQAPDSWQGKLDLLTAGAAASVVMHFMCAGEESSREAAGVASQRLTLFIQQMGSSGVNVAEASAYADDAYTMKVKAMWQANEGAACSGLKRLRDLATGTGFPAPRG